MDDQRWSLFWGGLLLIVGTVLLLSNLGLIPFSFGDIWRYGWPLILVVIGLLVMFGGNVARGQGASADHVVRYAGQEVRDVRLSYAIGDYDVYLNDAVFPDGTAHAKISHGIGDLDIWVPREIPVSVRASAGLGEIQVLDQKRDGFGPRVDYTTPDYAIGTKRLELQVQIGLGDISVQYAS